MAPAARVAIDPATGKMRPVEHDDAVQAGKPKANTAARSLVQTQGAPRPIISSQGVRGRVLDRSSMTYTVVRRNAEGGLDSACVQGDAAATKLMQGGPIARSTHAGDTHETE